MRNTRPDRRVRPVVAAALIALLGAPVAQAETPSGVLVVQTADLVVGPGGTLHGRVVDRGARPAAGIPVHLRTSQGQHVRSAVAGPQGDFTLAPVSPGTYLLTAGETTLAVRTWPAAAAPPAAGTALLIPVGDAVRGNLVDGANLLNARPGLTVGAALFGASLATVVVVTTTDSGGS